MSWTENDEPIDVKGPISPSKSNISLHEQQDKVHRALVGTTSKEQVLVDIETSRRITWSFQVVFFYKSVNITCEFYILEKDNIMNL